MSVQSESKKAECKCPYTACPRHDNRKKCPAYHHCQSGKTSCGK
ncbi:MAG: hypothetical protein WC071_10675 [Victivallaceae bacterium]